MPEAAAAAGPPASGAGCRGAAACSNCCMSWGWRGPAGGSSLLAAKANTTKGSSLKARGTRLNAGVLLLDETLMAPRAAGLPGAEERDCKFKAAALSKTKDQDPLPVVAWLKDTRECHTGALTQSIAQHGARRTARPAPMMGMRHRTPKCPRGPPDFLSGNVHGHVGAC